MVVTHTGSCHCGALEFEFTTPTPDAVAWDCDCSICAMKRNTHIIVPQEAFRLRSGAAPSEYRFGTRTAVHQFCAACGVCAFYRPRSNPEGVAVTLWCVRPGTLRSVEVKPFGGQDWERAYAETGIASATARAGGDGGGGGGGGSGGGGGGAE